MTAPEGASTPPSPPRPAAGAAPAGPPSSGAPVGQVLALERQVQEFWERENVAERALALHPEGPIFRFTEGPPTANGRPHIGHLLPRVLKDMGLRHRRMKGHRIVSTMAGWDCHGLPVEVEVEKAHGWTSKKQILEYGLLPFAQECRRSVLTHVEIWQQFSRRLGYWLDYAHPYHTMDAAYIESVWWSLKRLFELGLLEKGHYVVPYCPRCETPLATHEVAQGYRDTTDPSVTLRLRVLPPSGVSGEEGQSTYLLVWTTTPWTLPSNLAVAAGPELDYVEFQGDDGARYVMGSAAFYRYYPHSAQRPQVLRNLTGSELMGWTYEPPFPGIVPPSEARFHVHAASFVTTEEGTGLVHVAPSFGVDDYALGEKAHLGVFDPLDASGRFGEKVSIVAGKWFKDADRYLMEDLHTRGVLWRRETFRHTYPFCWRCDRPLMYRALDTWFVRTSRIRDRNVAHNAKVVWDPSHMRDGRFGNFVAEGKDWALSRNRYWGTPLPLWACPKGHYVAVGSFAELAALSAQALPHPFDPHRPGVDELSLACPEHAAPLVREPYVIDCWYDAGSAPFAQFHYPFSEGSPFDPKAPLDFIAEAIDQTRGWFYTLLVISSALFDRPAYLHVLCDGHGLDDEGKKMSKSKGNVSEPMALMERMGADPARLAIYLSDYTESFRFGDTTIRQTGLRSLTTLLNVLEFYRQNRQSDRVPPALTPPSPTDPLDRWLLSRLSATVENCDRALDEFDPRTAAQALDTLIQEISTWWLRRSRPRFWAEGDGPAKRSAYDTLSFTLATAAGLLAPLCPFTAEHLHQVVTGQEYRPGASSVHLLPYPSSPGPRDLALERAMGGLLEVVEVGRRLRMEAKVKSRFPLEELVVWGYPVEDIAPLGARFTELLCEELNVKRARMETGEETRHAPRGGEEFVIAPKVLVLEKSRLLDLVALSRRPSRELFLEGLARELVRRVQMTRKRSGLAPDDRIRLEVWAEGDLAQALESHQESVSKECLVSHLELHPGQPVGGATDAVKFDDVEGASFWLRLARS